MSIVQELKKLKKIKSEEVVYVLRELFSYEADSFFTKGKVSNSVDMGWDFWGDPWYFRKYKDSGKVVEDYWDKARIIEKEDGVKGYEKFHQNIEEVYCFKTYNKYVKKLEKVMAELVVMGFLVEITYDANPDKASWNKNPKKMILSISY